NRLKDLVPDPELPPAHEAVIAGGWWAVAFRDVGPGRAGAQPPIDTVQHLPVVCPRHTPRLVWQQRLDDRPLEVGQIVTARRAHQGSSQNLESRRRLRRYLL